jgi:hypothetical protein
VALGVLIGVHLRYARAPVAKLTTGKLLEWACVREGATTPTRVWSEANETVNGHLQKLVDVDALARFERPARRALGGCYTLHAPAWWTSTMFSGRRTERYVSSPACP